MSSGVGSGGDVALLPDVPRWTEKELLAREKEVLGRYLSSHPLTAVQGLIRRFATTDAQGLTTKGEGAPARLAGLVVALRPHLTKGGEPMGFLTLEDAQERVDVVLFPEAYAAHRAILVNDAIVMVEGRCSRRGERVSLLAERVVPIEQVPEVFAARVELTARLDGTDGQRLLGLRDILRAHAGPVPVTLWLVDEYGQRVKLAAEARLGIRPTDACLSALEAYLGTGAVTFQAKAADVAPPRREGRRRAPQPVEA